MQWQARSFLSLWLAMRSENLSEHRISYEKQACIWLANRYHFQKFQVYKPGTFGNGTNCDSRGTAESIPFTEALTSNSIPIQIIGKGNLI